jgi:hypothetical protein
MKESPSRLAAAAEKPQLRLPGQRQACADEADFLLAQGEDEPVACLRMDYGMHATRMFNAIRSERRSSIRRCVMRSACIARRRRGIINPRKFLQTISRG